MWVRFIDGKKSFLSAVGDDVPLDPIRIHEGSEDTASQRQRFGLAVFSHLRWQRSEPSLELLKTHSTPYNRLRLLHTAYSVIWRSTVTQSLARRADASNWLKSPVASAT